LRTSTTLAIRNSVQTSAIQTQRDHFQKRLQKRLRFFSSILSLAFTVMESTLERPTVVCATRLSQREGAAEHSVTVSREIQPFLNKVAHGPVAGIDRQPMKPDFPTKQS